MERYLVTVGVALGVTLPARLLAQNTEERSYTEITGTTHSPYRIAIPLAEGAEALGQQRRTLQQVLANDLGLTGIFAVLDARGVSVDPAKEREGLDREGWLQAGAQAVVRARVTLDGGTSLRIDLVLHDMGVASGPVLTMTRAGESARRLAHRFADGVVRYYTGEHGVFHTRIASTVHDPRRGSYQIHVMDFDGHGAYRVAQGDGPNVLPAWSPQGDLAFTGYLRRNPDLFVLWRGRRQPGAGARWAGLNTGAAFSPDGKEIALTLSKDGDPNIYVISRTGQPMRRLTDHTGIDTSPTWSPDGSQIAFVSDRAGSPQIYVVPARGGPPRRLTFAGSYNQEPAWCPRKDTPLVAFTGRDETGNYDIFTVNVRSGELTRLTQGQGSNKSPSWAPNGRLLVFSSSRGGLWVSTADGLVQRQIYRGNADTPAWSR